MNTLQKWLAVGASTVGMAVASLPASAALDISGAVTELQTAGTAATSLIGAAIVFAGICMAGFALYRRIK